MKTWMYAAVASVALTAFAGAVAPASAAHLSVNNVAGNNFGTFPGSDTDGIFGAAAVEAGDFMYTFNFTTNTAGFLNSTSVTTTGTNEDKDIDGLTLTLSGPNGFSPVVATDIFNSASLTSLASYEIVALTQAGQYSLTVSGTAGSSGSKFAGAYSFEPGNGGPGGPGTVVPGPIAGAGLPALMALGGFVWARRRKAAATV